MGDTFDPRLQERSELLASHFPTGVSGREGVSWTSLGRLFLPSSWWSRIRATGTLSRRRPSSVEGSQVLIRPGLGAPQRQSAGRDNGLYAFMRRVLATEHGQAIDRRRMATVEPVFGQVKYLLYSQRRR